MAPSLFIARILGPFLTVIGLGLLFEGETFRAVAEESLRSLGLIYLSGLITFVAGIAILNVHHLWVADWRVIITLFGWLGLVGGIFRILAPSLVQRVGEAMTVHPRLVIAGGLATFALGAFLTAMGYREFWAREDRPRRPRTAAARRANAERRRPRRKPRRATRARPPA